MYAINNPQGLVQWFSAQSSAWEVLRFFPSVSTSFLSMKLQVVLKRSTDGGRGGGGDGVNEHAVSLMFVSCRKSN